MSTTGDLVSCRHGIGPIGRVSRLIVGVGLLLNMADALDGGSLDLGWFDPFLGFIVLPGVMIATGLLARRYASGPLRFVGVGGHLGNLAVIVVLLSNPLTAGGASLFYGAAMLIAAWRSQRGCETTVISNLILRRDDQIGCPLFLPIDLIEETLRRQRNQRRMDGSAEKPASASAR